MLLTLVKGVSRTSAEILGWPEAEVVCEMYFAAAVVATPEPMLWPQRMILVCAEEVVRLCET